MAIVATGTAGAQIITMAFSPILTRLYGPEAFGILGTFTAIMAVLNPIAAWSYPIAIVLPKRDVDAVGLAKLSIGIAIAMSLLTALFLTIFKAQIIDIFNLKAIGSLILLLPFSMLFAAAMAIMTQRVIRKKLFKINAKVAVLKALWVNIAKAGAGLFAPFASVLVILTILGSALHASMLWRGVRKNTQKDIAIENISAKKQKKEYKNLAWRHRDFPYYRTPQIALNAASQGLPVLMLASFFGPAAAGFYSLGKMVLGMPTALIGKSVASVFYPRINEAVHNKEDPYRLLIKATTALAIVGLIPFGIIVAFGPWMFSFIFGDEWHTAGVYAQWLALWSYFGFMNRPSVGAIPVLSLQGYFLAYEVMSIGVRAALFFIGFLVFKNALIAIALFSIGSVALNFSLIIAILIAAKKRRE